jgi:hypothetical protein
VVTERKNRAEDRLSLMPSPAEWAALGRFGRDNLVRAPSGDKARPFVAISATAPFLYNGPALSDAERRALIEYLKSATHEDYPVRVIDRPRAAPCEDDPGWASR